MKNYKRKDLKLGISNVVFIHFLSNPNSEKCLIAMSDDNGETYYNTILISQLPYINEFLSSYEEFFNEFKSYLLVHGLSNKEKEKIKKVLKDENLENLKGLL